MSPRVKTRSGSDRGMRVTERRWTPEWAALGSVSARWGMAREKLRRWVRRAEVDGGVRSAVSTAERERIRDLERQNRELRRPFEWAVLPTGRSYFVAVTVRTRTSARVVTPLRLCDLIE